MKFIKRHYKTANSKILGLVVLIASFSLFSCTDFLDVKPDQGLVVPKTLEDVQRLLDNTNTFNVQPALPSISSEEVWISNAGFDALSNPIEQATFTWEEDPFVGGFGGDWNNVYEQVFYANVALQVLKDYEGTKDQEFERLLGSAHFLRGYAYHQLVNQFAPPYQKSGENSGKLGIVLKNTADINERLRRSSLEESYNQIVDDLTKAVFLLPETSIVKTRPNKAIALGTLSRVYLSMFQYAKAAEVAEEALRIYTDRLDFNQINVDAPRPFTRFDEETIFYSTLFSYSFFRSNQVFVNSELIELYEEHDLRLRAYYDKASNGEYIYTGKLSGATQNFGGISVGELYLNAAEAFCRSGQTAKGLDLLNEFLALRYNSVHWKPLNLTNTSELLRRVLQERRKELIGRGLRWTDLRRLNQEEDPITLVRLVKGNRYELAPNSLRYTFPIPQEEVTRSGIIQNQR